jgi:Transcriptional regulatory protein, C terminal
VREAVPTPNVVRFGAFEVDLRAGELRKSGLKLKLSGQPFQVLAILVERPGEVVTREELQQRLWPDTFVDAERGLNTAINKIREVLNDSSQKSASRTSLLISSKPVSGPQRSGNPTNRELVDVPRLLSAFAGETCGDHSLRARDSRGAARLGTADPSAAGPKPDPP